MGGRRAVAAGIAPVLAAGYEKSSPVRIGNAASDQMQIDVFGEVADAMFQALKAGMDPHERNRTLRPLLLDYLASPQKSTARRSIIPTAVGYSMPSRPVWST